MAVISLGEDHKGVDIFDKQENENKLKSVCIGTDNCFGFRCLTF